MTSTLHDFVIRRRRHTRRIATHRLVPAVVRTLVRQVIENLCQHGVTVKDRQYTFAANNINPAAPLWIVRCNKSGMIKWGHAAGLEIQDEELFRIGYEIYRTFHGVGLTCTTNKFNKGGEMRFR